METINGRHWYTRDVMYQEMTTRQPDMFEWLDLPAEEAAR